MALESATYINQLNALNPDGTDLVSTADDHLRLIKSTLKNTFPNVTGPVTLTQNTLNNSDYLLDTGTANNIIITPTIAWTSYTEGRGFIFKCSNNSTSASVTINVSALGQKSLVLADGNPAVVYSNSVYDVIYNGTAFVVKNSTIKKSITDIVALQPSSLTYTSVQGTGNLRLGAGSTDIVSVLSSGLIGINTMTPAYAMDIVGAGLRLQSGTTECGVILGDQTNQGSVYGNTSTMGISSSTSGNAISLGKTTTGDINIYTASSATPTLKISRIQTLNMGTFASPISKVNISSADMPSTGYGQFFELRNDSVTATNTSKFIRMSPTGTLEIRNSGNTTSILSLTDAGVLTPSGGVPAESINVGTLASSMSAVQQAINDSSYKLATTNFCNRNSSVSTTPTGYNWYTTPAGHTILWSNVTLNANTTLKVTLTDISSTFAGKTIVSLMNTIQSLTGNTQDYYAIKMLIGTTTDLGKFSIINTTGTATPVFYQVVMV
jgi:hypothetical protein